MGVLSTLTGLSLTPATTEEIRSPSLWALVRSSKDGTRVCLPCVLERNGSWSFLPTSATATVGLGTRSRVVPLSSSRWSSSTSTESQNCEVKVYLLDLELFLHLCRAVSTF